MRCFQLALIHNLEYADGIQMFLVPLEYLRLTRAFMRATRK